jgi:tetratricopeptide (TPR) repeat protein
LSEAQRHSVNTPGLRFRAFLSYSHRDSRLATRLHRRLEAYRVPRKLRNGRAEDGEIAQPRIRPVFRDRDELASATSLTHSIEQALDASEALVVVCSPAASASRWVNEEIRYFRTHHPDRPVFAFVVAGDPGLDPRTHAGKAAFPPNLAIQYIDQPDGPLSERIAADARAEGDGFHSAFLKLVAGLLAVSYDQLRQRDLVRRQKNWMLAGSASLALTATFAVLAWRATVARNEAREARAQAELELLSERQTREFLLSVFHLADPSEARGNEITVREVLDRAVARIDSTEFARPVIRSRFLATMGQAYSSLGINQRSIELLQQSLAALPMNSFSGDALSAEAWAQRIDSQLELADVQFSMGDYAPALEVLDATLAAESEPHLKPAQKARAANIRGDILSYTERDAEAMKAYASALALLDGAALSREEDASIRARSVGGIALLRHVAGEFAESQRVYATVVDLLVSVFGGLHPDTIWAMTSWGSAAYSNGDLEAAEEAWSNALASASKALGADHPEVGTIKNNLARLKFESGAYAEAETMLREALAIDRSRRSASFDDLAYTLNNLALVRLALGDASEAESLLREALPIAQDSHHRMLGPILTALADIQCRAGEASGSGLAEHAVTAGLEEFGDNDWNMQRAVLTRAYCAALAGGQVDLKAVDTALCVITTRWGEQNYFSVRGNEQRQVIMQALVSRPGKEVIILPFRPPPCTQ